MPVAHTVGLFLLIFLLCEEHQSITVVAELLLG